MGGADWVVAFAVALAIDAGVATFMSAPWAGNALRPPAGGALTGEGCAQPVLENATRSDAITMGVVFCRMARTIAESK